VILHIHMLCIQAQDKINAPLRYQTAQIQRAVPP